MVAGERADNVLITVPPSLSERCFDIYTSARQQPHIGSSRVSAVSCVVDHNHGEINLSVVMCEHRLPSKQLGATFAGVIRLHHSRRLVSHHRECRRIQFSTCSSLARVLVFDAQRLVCQARRVARYQKCGSSAEHV